MAFRIFLDCGRFNEGLYAIIDGADAPRISAVDWRAASSSNGKTVYAVTDSTRIGKDQRLMHRMILGAEIGQKIDHKDGDGLNNRRENLRAASSSQNAQNSFVQVREDGKTSRFKGVQWDVRRTAWVASITLDGKYQDLGAFGDEEDAALAYDTAALRLFGDFAKTNAIMGLFDGAAPERRINLHTEGEIVPTPIHVMPEPAEPWERAITPKPAYVRRLHRLRGRIARSQQTNSIRNKRPPIPSGGR